MLLLFVLALAGVLGGIWLSWPVYQFHQSYFGGYGPWSAVIRALPLALAAGALLYARWIRHWIARYEVALLILFPLVLALVRVPLDLLTALGILAGCLGFGLTVRKPLQLAAAELPVLWAAGIGAYSWAISIAGLAGFLYWPVLAAPLLAGVVRLALDIRFVWAALPRGAAPDGPYSSLAVFFAYVFSFISSMLAICPSTIFDVLAYHFPLAQHFAGQHNLQPVPQILQSYYPQAVDVLAAAAFSLRGSGAAQFLLPGLGLLFLWILYRIARTCSLPSSIAWTGVLLSAALPFLHFTLSVPKNDSGLILFQAAALYSLLMVLEGRGTRWFLLAAFFIGLTFGAKYTALFGAIGFAPVLAVCWWRMGRPVWICLLALLICLSAGFFWMGRNYVLTGNPVYPEAIGRAGDTGAAAFGDGPKTVFARYLDMPRQLLLSGYKAFESPSPVPLGATFLLFIPVLVWQAARNPLRLTIAQQACVLFAVFYLVYWSRVLITLRYAALPVALLVLLLAAGLHRLHRESPRWLRPVWTAAVFYCLVFALLSVFTMSVNRRQFSYYLGSLDREGYVTKVLPEAALFLPLGRQDPRAALSTINACARFYAPNPLSFACEFCATEQCDVQPMLSRARSMPHGYLVLPKSPNFEPLVRRLLETGEGALAYQTAMHQAFRINAPAPARTPPRP